MMKMSKDYNHFMGHTAPSPKPHSLSPEHEEACFNAFLTHFQGHGTESLKSHWESGHGDNWRAAYATGLAARQGEAVPHVDPSGGGWVPLPYGLHPDTAELVLRFAFRLAAKLHKAERKYGYTNGWKNPDWMDECRDELRRHIEKGDPVDVAAYCAFLSWHMESTNGPAPPAEQPAATLSEERVISPQRDSEVVFPDGYCLDPNGNICIPYGKDIDFHFGYDLGFEEAWQILTSASRAARKKTPGAVDDPYKLTHADLKQLAALIAAELRGDK
jgi:hypothetical protein